MIGTTLDFIAQELNQHICNRLKLNPSVQKVQLSSIADADGTLAVKDHNLLLLKLINIEPDPIANDSLPVTRAAPGSLQFKASPLYLNLKLILAAYFKPEEVQAGLDMLTMGISYLQGKRMWNPQNSPGLPTSMDRIVFEMESLDLHQLNHIWGAVGTKYLPSAIYKLRMVVIDDNRILEEIPSITGVSTNTSDAP